MATGTSAGIPPGSLGLPWLGETLQWMSDPFRFCEERFRAHGPVFKSRILGDTVLFCTGPAAFTKFLDTEHFSRQGAAPPHVEALVGQGTLPFVEGPGQRRNKRLLLQAFRQGPTRGYVEAVTPIIDRCLARWADQGDLLWFPEIERMTMQIFDTLVAGADPQAENERLRVDLDTFLRGILALPLPIGGYARALKARDRILAYLREVVAARRKAPRADVASHILAARDESGQGFSDDEAAREMIHILFAGYGVMSINFAWAGIALGEQPALRERARAEVLERSADPPSLEDLLKLDYVGQVWKELMRFYPAVPHTFMAQVVKPVEIGGYHVPAGWKAMGVLHAGLHDEKVYKDPGRFDPDRFGPGREEDRKAENAFVAQGGGPPEGHRCLGESVSAVVMRLYLARLLRGYTWELKGKPEISTSFPVAPKGGLPVRLRRL
jgi:cytochrome P450